MYCLGITALELAFNTTPFTDWPPLKVEFVILGVMLKSTLSYSIIIGPASQDGI